MLGRIAEQRAQLLDALAEVLELRLDLLAREPGQAREPQVEDRLRLDLAEREALLQLCARVVGVGGGADERDDRVDVVERDEVALEHVRAALGLVQLVLRPADDDLALEVEVVRDELEQRQRLAARRRRARRRCSRTSTAAVCA